MFIRYLFNLIKVGRSVRLQNSSLDIPGARVTPMNFVLKKSLTIIANRTHKYEDGTILSSIENTINSQILKGLLFYCSIAKDLPIIKNVSIHLLKNDQLVYIYKETSNFKQPFKTSVQKSYSFTPKQLEILFDTSKKASTLRIALSYWLKSQDTTSSFIKFTYLWRAFGRIYLYQGNSKSETTGQINIRNLIISIAHILTNSLSLASNITQNMLNLFRWKKLVIHEYEDRSKMPALKGFIQRYKDGRIMISINDIIDVRKDYLIYYEKNGIKQDLWNGPDGVKIWLLNNFQSREDVETLTILCIKYAYF